jgi:hypothetical protein
LSLAYRNAKNMIAGPPRARTTTRIIMTTVIEPGPSCFVSAVEPGSWSRAKVF